MYTHTIRGELRVLEGNWATDSFQTQETGDFKRRPGKKKSKFSIPLERHKKRKFTEQILIWILSKLCVVVG